MYDKNKIIDADYKEVSNNELEEEVLEEELDDEFQDELEEIFEEEFEDEFQEEFEMSEPKNGGIKEWFEERKAIRLAKKQQKEELHNQGIYTKGEAIRTNVSKYAFGLLTIAAVGCFAVVAANILISTSLLIPVLKLAVCAGVFGVSRKIYKETVAKQKEIKEVTEKEPKMKQNKKDKKNKKSKTKKPNLFKRIKNVVSKNKQVCDEEEVNSKAEEKTAKKKNKKPGIFKRFGNKKSQDAPTFDFDESDNIEEEIILDEEDIVEEEKNNKSKENKAKKKNKKPSIFKRFRNRKSQAAPAFDFDELDNIEEDVVEEEVVETENNKPKKQKENFDTQDILNVKLNRGFKNVKMKEANISFVPGIGVYIYPVSKDNDKEQKFFEAGYEAVYEEKPMSIETETHKVYVLNKFSK